MNAAPGTFWDRFYSLNTMFEPKNITTHRLHLRTLSLVDAPAVQRLASDHDIAATTLSIPHPYPEDAAEQWIRTGVEAAERGELANFVITLTASGDLVGWIGLSINSDHDRAEMGYWIGKPYWGCGYATEAARAVLHYGFETVGLNRIVAHHMIHNPASGRILTKIGMQREGFMPQHIKKWDRYVDLIAYGITRRRYDELIAEPRTNEEFERTK